MVVDIRGQEIAWLRGEARRWVDAGIVSARQADEILRLEEGSAGAGGEEGSPPRAARLPLVAELVSYLGIVLVAASGAVVVVRSWADLHVGGRIAVGVVIACVGLVGGTLVTHVGDAGARRLGGFLWFWGTGGVALVVGVAVDSIGGQNPHTTVLAVGLAVLAVSDALWRNRDRPLQFLTWIAGIVLTAVGFSLVVGLGLTNLELDLIVWAAAVLLGALGARNLLHPELVVLLVAEVGALYAPLGIVDTRAALGLALGLATAVVCVASGLLLKRIPLVAVGIIGFLAYLGATLGRYLNGPVAALGVFVVGIALVVGAIWWGMRASASGPAHRRETEVDQLASR